MESPKGATSACCLPTRVWSPRSALLERHLLHVEEHLQRVELKSLDVRARRADLVRVVHEDPRRVIVEDLVGLLVDLPPLALIADLAPLNDQPVELGVVVAGPVGRPGLP